MSAPQVYRITVPSPGMKAGIFLKSTSLLDDTFFEKSVILVTEHNEKGAMGFVVNLLFPRRLNELEEFKHAGPFPIHLGGPVDQEHLYFVHRRPDLIKDGTQITSDIYFGGDFAAAVSSIQKQELTEHDIKIFIGYCGWDFGELEQEVSEGSWETMEAADVF